MTNILEGEFYIVQILTKKSQDWNNHRLHQPDDLHELINHRVHSFG